MDFYDGSSECTDGDYRCKNDRCFPKSAHDCDGIDWCTDTCNSGCEDVVLIVGLSLGISAFVLGLGMGIATHIQNRRKREGSSRRYTASAHSRQIPDCRPSTLSLEHTTDYIQVHGNQGQRELHYVMLLQRHKIRKYVAQFQLGDRCRSSQSMYMYPQETRDHLAITDYGNQLPIINIPL